jgi:hypothetical protein
MPLQPVTQNWTPTNLRIQRGRNYDPFVHAEALNIQVLHRPLTRNNELWLPKYNTIILKTGMRPAAQRCALAHGIGHADLAHTDDRPKFEMQADRYASCFLIDPGELWELTVWSPDWGMIATELGVTRRLLAAYLDWTDPRGPRIAPSPEPYEDHFDSETGIPSSPIVLSDQLRA